MRMLFSTIKGITDMNYESFSSIAFSRKVMPSAIRVSLLVGTVLAFINHGEKILAMSLTIEDTFRIVLTYIVPYSVSTWSAVKAIRSTRVLTDNE